MLSSSVFFQTLWQDAQDFLRDVWPLHNGRASQRLNLNHGCIHLDNDGWVENKYKTYLELNPRY